MKHLLSLFSFLLILIISVFSCKKTEPPSPKKLYSIADLDGTRYYYGWLRGAWDDIIYIDSTLISTSVYNIDNDSIYVMVKFLSSDVELKMLPYSTTSTSLTFTVPTQDYAGGTLKYNLTNNTIDCFFDTCNMRYGNTPHRSMCSRVSIKSY